MRLVLDCQAPAKLTREIRSSRRSRRAVQRRERVAPPTPARGPACVCRRAQPRDHQREHRDHSSAERDRLRWPPHEPTFIVPWHTEAIKESRRVAVSPSSAPSPRPGPRQARLARRLGPRSSPRPRVGSLARLVDYIDRSEQVTGGHYLLSPTRTASGSPVAALKGVGPQPMGRARPTSAARNRTVRAHAANPDGTAQAFAG